MLVDKKQSIIPPFSQKFVLPSNFKQESVIKGFNVLFLWFRHWSTVTQLWGTLPFFWKVSFYNKVIIIWSLLINI